MKVFFALPIYRGMPRPECAKSLENTLRLMEERGHTAIIGTCSGCCYVQFARNSLVREFMGSDADKLFFIDDDISWEAKDALRLIESEDDVVAGAYRKKQDNEEFPVVIFTDANDRAFVRSDGAIPAEGVPGGFLCIKRSVIEKLIAAHPENRYFDFKDGVRRDGFYDLFPQGVYNGRWVGEDFAFCNLWLGLSGQIWIIPDITISHHSDGGTWTGNFHEFLLRQPGGSLDPKRNTGEASSGHEHERMAPRDCVPVGAGE